MDRASSEGSFKTAQNAIPVTATGQIIAAGQSGVISGAVIAAAADAASLKLHNGTSAAGELLLSVKAPANDMGGYSASAGIRYSDGVFAELGGTAPDAVVYATHDA